MIKIDLSVSQLTAAQRTALQTAAPILKIMLRRFLRVWRRMTPEQRVIFMEKNPVIANLVEAIQESFE